MCLCAACVLSWPDPIACLGGPHDHHASRLPAQTYSPHTLQACKQSRQRTITVVAQTSICCEIDALLHAIKRSASVSCNFLQPRLCPGWKAQVTPKPHIQANKMFCNSSWYSRKLPRALCSCWDPGSRCSMARRYARQDARSGIFPCAISKE